MQPAYYSKSTLHSDTMNHLESRFPAGSWLLIRISFSPCLSTRLGTGSSA